jgi:hypothetical protein
MTNSKTSFRWTKFTNGIGYVAIATLEVEQNPSNQNEIIENYNGHGFTSQGAIEEVSKNGYNSWKIAARDGLAYAFSLIDSYWTVHLNKIEGITTDTNPTIVGYTVLRAFFDKINFQLTSEQIEKLEEFVLNSWANPHKELIPDFFNLTFTEFDN